MSFYVYLIYMYIYNLGIRGLLYVCIYVASVSEVSDKHSSVYIYLCPMILANFKCKSQYLGYCHVFLEFPGPNGYFQGRTHFFRATLKMQYFEILGKIMVFLCISHFPTSSHSIHSCFSPHFPLSRALNCPCLGVKPKALE